MPNGLPRAFSDRQQTGGSSFLGKGVLVDTRQPPSARAIARSDHMSVSSELEEGEAVLWACAKGNKMSVSRVSIRTWMIAARAAWLRSGTRVTSRKPGGLLLCWALFPACWLALTSLLMFIFLFYKASAVLSLTLYRDITGFLRQRVSVLSNPEYGP